MDNGIMTEEELRELTTFDYQLNKYKQKLIQKNKFIIEQYEIIIEKNEKIIKNNNLMNKLLLRENDTFCDEINRLKEENKILELENEN